MPKTLETVLNPHFDFAATTIALSTAHPNAPTRSTHTVILYEHPYNREPLITKMVSQENKQLVAGLSLEQINRGYLHTLMRIPQQLQPELTYQAAKGPIAIYHYALTPALMQEQFDALRDAIRKDLILVLAGSPFPFDLK